MSAPAPAPAPAPAAASSSTRPSTPRRPSLAAINSDPRHDGPGGFPVRVLGAALIFAFCMRIWISGIFQYIEMQDVQGRWPLTDASVVGANSTLRNESFGRTTYFCPLLNYNTISGQNITVISPIDCYRSKRFAEDLIGGVREIRYDPMTPENFMEQNDFETEKTRLLLVISCGIILSIVFVIVWVRVIQNAQNNERERERDEELANDPVLARKEREKLIRSRLYFQKVSADKKSVDVSSIRSTREDANNKSKEEYDEEAALDTEKEEVEEEMGDDGSAIGPQDTSTPALAPAPPEETKPTTFSVRSLACTLLPSWRRPAGVSSECCICLEEYEQDDIICTSKTAECNHVFHEQCVTSWLLAGHDQCPLCRINLLKEESLQKQ